MKKFIIAALIAATTASFAIAGCDKNEEPKDTATAQTGTTLSGEEIDASFNIGEAKDNIYTNDFFDIKYTGTDDWRLLNEEQLATISTSIKDVLTNEEAKKALENGKTSIIMYAVARDALSNASLTVQKHDINNTHEADMDAFLDKTVTDLSERLPAQGFTDPEVEKTDLTFCGEPAKGIKIKAKYKVKSAEETTEAKQEGEESETKESDEAAKTEERDIYETMVYIFKGSYSGCVTVTSFDEDKTGEVLKMFTKAQ